MYQNILDKLVEVSKYIFGTNLTGVYLHGSMAMGCFCAEKSDIDLIVVIEDDITDEQKLLFMNEVIELNSIAPEKGLELSIVKKEYCNNFVYPTPFELHFSKMHIQWFTDNPKDFVSKMKGADKDLAAHFTIINHCGIVLYGGRIEDVFSVVPKMDYIDSIWEDIEGAKEDILSDPMYIILNLCRVAAYLKEDLVTSKKQGGEWGLQNLKPQYHELIQEALGYYVSNQQMHVKDEEAQAFAEYMLAMIKDMLGNH